MKWIKIHQLYRKQLQLSDLTMMIHYVCCLIQHVSTEQSDHIQNAHRYYSLDLLMELFLFSRPWKQQTSTFKAMAFFNFHFKRQFLISNIPK